MSLIPLPVRRSDRRYAGMQISGEQKQRACAGAGVVLTLKGHGFDPPPSATSGKRPPSGGMIKPNLNDLNPYFTYTYTRLL